MSREEKRSDSVIVAVGIFLMAAAIIAAVNFANSNSNTISMGQDIGGTILARYIGGGPTFYIAVDVNGKRVEVSVSEEEFEFYKVGDYFVIKK